MGAFIKATLSVGLLLWAVVATASNVTLRYWSFLDPASKDPRSVAQTQMIDAFTAANPDISVKVEVVHWSKMVPLLITAAGAHQAPDVALIHYTRIPEAVDSGSIIPIDRFVDTLPKSELDDFLLPLDKTRYNGHLYSISVEHRIEGMLLYRKDLFEKAGLPGPPKTWVQLAQDSKKLAQPPGWGFVWALSRKDAAADVKMLQPLYWSAGSDFYKPDGSAAINGPVGVQIAKTMLDLAFVDKTSPPYVVGVEESRTMMKGGTTAMFVEGTQIFQSVRASKTVGTNLLTAPLPALTEAAYPPPAMVTGQTLAISKDAKDPAAAWRFVQFMTGPKAQLISAKVGLNMPVRKSIFADPWFATDEGKIITGWKDYVVAHGRPPAQNTLSVFLSDSLGLAYEEILSGRKDPKTALDQAAARYDERRAKH
jgi:multiple sugar transport system substrate-binding protein